VIVTGPWQALSLPQMPAFGKSDRVTMAFESDRGRTIALGTRLFVGYILWTIFGAFERPVLRYS